MWEVFNTIANNAGLGFEYIVLIVVIIGSMIFMARDFKLGLVMLFILSGGLFMWFYQDGTLNWSYPLIVFFITLILLALNLFAIAKSHKVGRII